MDIDPRALPPHKAEEDDNSNNDPSTPPGDPTPDPKDVEIEALKTKNLELQSQKDHWKTKYERDVKPPTPSGDIPPEDPAPNDKVAELEKKLSAMEEKELLKELRAQYPALEEKKTEFDEFKLEYPGVALDKVAKIFLVEKGLLSKPIRRGLETPTGGGKGPTEPGMTEAEVKRLRETQPRKYQQMLRDGRIKPENIH